MEDKKNLLTNAFGKPVDDDQASQSTGMRENGYTLLQDTYLMEKLAHFNRERIPERVVHAKGAGAGGYFEVTHDISKYTKAKFLSEIGKKTDVFVRFSTVGGERGSADSARDPRGFAVKFYTEEGNYDMVGNNTPTFFIRDAIKFPDFVHTQKRNPQNNLKDANMFWDFLSLTPESVHQVTILFSDRGTPKDYRHMDGHSSHTFMFYNDKNEHYWFKWHFKTVLGNETLTAEEAEEIAGSNPDHATDDLFNAIEKGDYPEWKVYVQIMTNEEAKNYKFDPFDITKVWYHADFPLIPVGRMVLNKNPENYFAEVEQVKFSPGSFVPGIAASPDKLLQGRLFAYDDAHRYRLGVNNHQIPVNAPKGACPYHFQRDGFMTVDGNGGKGANYYPNSFTNTHTCKSYAPPQININGVIGRHDRINEDVDYIQAGELYSRVLDDTHKKHLVSNIAGHLKNANKNIQYRQTAIFYKANVDYGTNVAKLLDLDINKVKDLANMSHEERVKATMNS